MFVNLLQYNSSASNVGNKMLYTLEYLVLFYLYRNAVHSRVMAHADTLTYRETYPEAIW
jgi:hypothetical protein